MPRDYKQQLDDILQAITFIHEYFGVNLKIVWDVIKNKLDALETTCGILL